MVLNAATIDELLGRCICMTCPSWVNCVENGGYCVAAIGKSACKREKGVPVPGARHSKMQDLPLSVFAQKVRRMSNQICDAISDIFDSEMLSRTKFT